MKRFIVPLLVAVMVVSIIFAGCMPAAAPPVTPPVAPPIEDPMAKWGLAVSWYPLEVEGNYGTYDIATLPEFPLDLPAGSLEPAVREMWPGPVKAERTYHIGVVWPHLMDPWWASWLYGIIDEGRLCEVDITAYTAGGYGEITRQISQIKALVALPVDLLIAAPVSYEALTPPLEEAVAAGIPVVTAINDNTLENPQAKVLTSYYLTYGMAAASIVIDHSEEARAAGKVVQVGLFPGPGGLAWTGATELGFKDAIAEAGLEAEIEIVATKWGVSESSVQAGLIEPVMVAYPELDYIVGCGPAASAAVPIVDAAGRAGKTHIVSTYLTQPLYFAIIEGKILAAPWEKQQFLARTAVDCAVRVLNGEESGVDFPFRTGIPFDPVTTESVYEYSWEHLFYPEGWEPVFRYRVPEALRVD